MKPRIVENELSVQDRFLTAAAPDTGTWTEALDTDGLNASYLCESGAAGRTFASKSFTATAGQWYCVSFEVVSQALSASGGTASGFQWSGTAPDNGDSAINENNIVAGGNGRYAGIFMDTTGGAFTWRLGVGLNADTADKSLEFRELQFEKIDLSQGGIPSEYVYPGYKAAFRRANYSTFEANHLVTESYGNYYDIEKGNILLALGDSRTDEVNDIGGALSNALGLTGVCQVHAEGGWESGDLVGPTVLHTSFSTTSQKAISGTLRARTFSTGGNEEMADNQGVHPDVVIISNFLVNDIVDGAGGALNANEALTNIETIVDQIIEAGKKPCITEMTPFNAWASFSETNGDQVQAYVVNRRLKEIALAKSAIFVPLYKAFGDSTDADKLSDGAGSTPDYSTDGVHLNAEGSRVAAGLILNSIQLWQQS